MQALYLGIEIGSTRIKSVLIDGTGAVAATGEHVWENKLEGGYWTYALEDVWKGIQDSYASLKSDYRKRWGLALNAVDGMGVSAMMHGYLAFDAHGNLLVPFRTWRNTNTARAAEELSKALSFNMPQRWSAAHFYQAVLDSEPHVGKVKHLDTLASYVHRMLTDTPVIGIGDASGMFPIRGSNYDADRLAVYNGLLRRHNADVDMAELLPKVLTAGEFAGTLTAAGAKLLDPTGALQAGAKFCPPEGDAGTGMTATDAVKAHTGNVSAGTSAFAMVVLDKPLQREYPEIDMVTTPDGKPVAMVHVNNCTSEINAWADLFEEVIALGGGKLDRGELMQKLFLATLASDAAVGGLTGYNFLSGEPIVGLETGAPLILRNPKGKLDLANFMQMHVYSALAALRLGMEILEREGVRIDAMCGHGGFFKTEHVGAAAMSAALGAPVTVMRNAGEGGAWGIALLALYADKKTGTLDAFLDALFRGVEKETVSADEQEKAKFAAFMEGYKKHLDVARTAANEE